MCVHSLMIQWVVWSLKILVIELVSKSSATIQSPPLREQGILKHHSLGMSLITSPFPYLLQRGLCFDKNTYFLLKLCHMSIICWFGHPWFMRKLHSDTSKDEIEHALQYSSAHYFNKSFEAFPPLDKPHLMDTKQAQGPLPILFPM